MISRSVRPKARCRGYWAPPNAAVSVPLAVDGEAQSDGDRWHLRLTVEGERDEANLQQQLEKLYDCLAVEVSPCR